MARIFHLLPNKDLKKVMLVCKAWKDMVEVPTLWTWLEVKLNSRGDFQKLNIQRLLFIEAIEVGYCEPWLSKFFRKHVCQWKESDWIELFKVMLQLPNLKMIWGFEFTHTNLSFMEPVLLVSVFLKLEQLRLGNNNLTLSQSEHLFNAIAGNKSNLRYLVLHGKCCVMLSPQLFASGLSRVNEVYLSDSYITQEQMVALFEGIIEKEDQLKKLSMYNCSSQDIEPELIGKALSRLEQVSIDDTWVKTEQSRAILVKAVEEQSKLAKFCLDMNGVCDFADLDPALVKQAKDKFGIFYYWNSDYDMGYNSSDEEDASDEVEEGNSVEHVEYNSEEVGISSDEYDDISEEDDEGIIFEHVEDVTTDGHQDKDYNKEVWRLMSIFAIDKSIKLYD